MSEPVSPQPVNDPGYRAPRAPVIPPPPQANAAPAPQAPAQAPQRPAAPTVEQVMNVPSPQPARPAAPAPAPAAAAPAPPPPPAAPAQNGVQYAKPEMLVQLTVDGKKIDMPIADLVAKGQMLNAAEKRFAQAGQLRADLQRESEIGKVVLAHQNNPEMLLQRLAELTGKPIAVHNTKTETEDDGLDPQTRELKAEVQALKLKNSKIDQFFAEKQASDTLSEIRHEAEKYALYQQDPRERQHLETVVAANLNLGMPRDQIASLVGQLHAERAETLSQQATSEATQRAANVQTHATVPPSAGTPGMTDTSPARIPAEQWQKGTGAFGQGWRNILRGVTQP